ncbi:hypothetical protein N9937_01030 [bacterium]|nr:hypothetical protein [bacterium]
MNEEDDIGFFDWEDLEDEDNPDVGSPDLGAVAHARYSDKQKLMLALLKQQKKVTPRGEEPVFRAKHYRDIYRGTV